MTADTARAAVLATAEVRRHSNAAPLEIPIGSEDDESMADERALGAADLNHHVATVVGKRISRVLYYGLSYEAGEEMDWDFGEWHWPVHGVELTMDDGTTYSALWGEAFGHFDLEVLPEPMSIRLRGAGDSDGPRVWEVTDHPSWAAHVGDRVTAARIVWMPGEPSDEQPWEERQAPIALQLSFSTGEVWVVAAEPMDLRPPDRFYLGQNEVIVVFTPEFAAHIGLPTLQ